MNNVFSDSAVKSDDQEHQLTKMIEQRAVMEDQIENLLHEQNNIAQDIGKKAYIVEQLEEVSYSL